MPVDSIQHQQNELSIRNDAMRRVGDKPQASGKAMDTEASAPRDPNENESITRRYTQRGNINRFDALRGQTIDTRV